ncbi:lytic transglycosylase domain-containing protein [Bradyrhizobium lablabi]|uniref:lytic transglycosylase domain-containing protein n=1 Tax=Bradyrhizobium lablabi TaxID=722472 RepID=UPI001BA6AC81|nr:lytic transglycosylase domain-containing protein [Bradyrhizobium lablabi]MBR1120437.1 lytic transglycosylase domain-containing protein [Bradyrhizobium lablabi]
MAKTHAKRPADIFVLIALCALAWVVVPAANANAATNARQRVVQPAKKPEVKKQEAKKPEPKAAAKKPAAAKPAREVSGKKAAKTASKKGRPAKHAAKAKRSKKPADDDDDDEDEAKPSKPPLTGDLAAVKNAIDLARRGKTDDATDAMKAIADPAGQKLAEWFLLRHSETQARFGRYAAFLKNNPDWPSNALLRRRAEARLWQEKADAATIKAFFADKAPLTAKGRFALARVLLAEGDRLGAAREVKAAWRAEELGEATEEMAYEEFRDLLAREDHRARMDKRIGAKEISAAMRAAKRLGEDDVAIVKACAAVKGDADTALGKLNDVPESARGDLGYVLCRVKWAMKKDKIVEAAKMIIAAAPETMAQQDTDEWWRDRRTISRKLLDMGEFQMAYDVVKDAATPGLEAYRADYAFMPGWIALRYLNDPATAKKYFADIDKGLFNPITLARANYWRARAAEAAGDAAAARAFYEASAKYHTAYYGQMSRKKLGLEAVEVRMQQPEAVMAASSDERVRAAEMLYAVGEKDMVKAFAHDLGEECQNEAVIAAVGEVTYRREDAAAMLQLGKNALGRGLAADHYAFPIVGIPAHTQHEPAIEHGMIYSVARTESAFDQRDHSHADAVGLMQVTPEAGKDTARRFGFKYDWERLRKDPVYNTQVGAAELSALISEYKGSQIMTFAGYNAGRGRVRDWIKLRGDPRDPNVDPVDWVERIPFSETRNYVQRVMENLAVYRERFGTGTSAPAMVKQETAPVLAVAKPGQAPALAATKQEPAPAPVAAKPEQAPAPVMAKPQAVPAAVIAKPEQAPAPGQATAAAQATASASASVK